MTIDIQIKKENGESFTFEQYGIIVKDFVVSSIPIDPVYAKPEGSDRRVDYGATYDARTIKVPFEARAHDLHDYPLLRDFLFEKILDKEPFYIREMRRAKKLAYAFVDTDEAPRMMEGTENRFIGGKRYLVRLQNTFDLDQMELDGEGELIFETTELPFAESIGTTQDIQRNGISANEELWGFGMGLIADDDSLKYTHTGTTFRIYNAGNVPIHPFDQELKITISNIQGSGSFLQLRNNTNGTTFRVNDSSLNGKTIVIDGPEIKINSLQEFRKTNRKYIELDTGWNQFTLTGATSAKVEFDFPFYYM